MLIAPLLPGLETLLLDFIVLETLFFFRQSRRVLDICDARSSANLSALTGFSVDAEPIDLFIDVDDVLLRTLDEFKQAELLSKLELPDTPRTQLEPAQLFETFVL